MSALDVLWFLVSVVLVGWVVDFMGVIEAVGTFVQVLLVVAVFMIFFRLIRGR